MGKHKLPIVVGKDINQDTDKVMSLAALGRMLGVKGITVYQWVKHGRLSESRTRIVKLRYIKMPSGMASSMKAYREFVELLNDTDQPAPRDESCDETYRLTDNGHVLMKLSVNELKWLSTKLPTGDRLKADIDAAMNEAT